MARPSPRFHDFIGHRHIVDLLKRQLEGATAHSEPFPHTLLSGPSGVGKTILAQALAGETGTQLIKVMGYSDRRRLTESLGRLSPSDFLFVDEAHRLGFLEQELLMEAIDLHSIPNIATSSTDNTELRQLLSPWSLIAATDQPGELLPAFVNRMPINQELDYYSETELREIVSTMAEKANILLTPQAATLIAKVSNGLPRQAKHHLQSLRLYHPNAEGRRLSVEDVRECLDAFGFDDTGMGSLERRYLIALSKSGTASLTSLAIVLGSDSSYLKRQIEGPLLRKGLIAIHSSGRRLTVEGQACVQRQLSIFVPNSPEETQNEAS